MSLRILVVGTGSIGSRHIKNLTELSDIEIVAHDIDPESVDQIGAEYGVEITTDLDATLTPDIDCVFVCTPPVSHLEIAHAALDVGADVFIEKPLSHDLDGTDEFVERARNSDQTVFVACNMRFHPPVVQIQEWLDAGEIGPLQFFRLRYGNDLRNWRSTDYRDSYSANAAEGGGIILDVIHELDIALHWMRDVEYVSSTVAQVSDLEIDIEDTAEIILEGDRMMAEVHLDCIRPERARTYELIGRDGMIRWEARGKNPEQSTLTLHRRDSSPEMTEEFELTLNEQYVDEIEHFLNCVRGTEEATMDAHRGLDVLKLAYAAKESSSNRSAVQYWG